ncbi:MAG TPA: tRNA (adenosine(37)-N6)-threonylcarbamoyltransferase complex dimerization subunit type 1 TsaB [Rectinemataceae bacterium]
MNILAFDSSCEALSVCVVSSAGDRAIRVLPGLRQAESLLPGISGCLDELSMGIGDIGLIGCAIGPGSFMGLRVGLATAKGLSLGTGAPWVGVPTLDAAAKPYAGLDGLVIPLLDARKKRLYAAVYRGGRRESEYLDIGIGDLLALLYGEDRVSFVGSGAEALADLSQERAGWAVVADEPGERAVAVAELAREILEREGPSPADAGPLYLREPNIG